MSREVCGCKIALEVLDLQNAFIIAFYRDYVNNLEQYLDKKRFICYKEYIQLQKQKSY